MPEYDIGLKVSENLYIKIDTPRYVQAITAV